jgi:hypothetical protein
MYTVQCSSSPNYGTYSTKVTGTVLYVIHYTYPVFPLFVSNPNVYDIKKMLLNRTQKARIVPRSGNIYFGSDLEKVPDPNTDHI